MENIQGPLNIDQINEWTRQNSTINTILYHKQIDSTNATADTLIRSKNFSNGTIILAEEQTTGKGRLGRTWFSPKHDNIYMSIILKNEMPVNDLFFMTAIASLAVRNNLIKKFKLKATIKWPNDILVRKKKISGILIEITEGYFIIGIGLNVNFDPAQCLELKDSATSILKETKKPASREEIIRDIAIEIERLLSVFQQDKNTIFSSWKRALTIPSSQIKITLNGKEMTGKILSLENDGSLLFQTGKQKINLHSIDSY